jgi:hypothetical protein
MTAIETGAAAVSMGGPLRGDLARYRRLSLDAVCFRNRARSGSGVVNCAVHWILLASGCPIAKSRTRPVNLVLQCSSILSVF